MADEPVNPYQAPGDPGEVELPAGLWRAGEGGLLIRDGARLPPIDVFSGPDREAGEAGAVLLPVSREFAVVSGARAGLRLLVLFAGPAVIVFLALRNSPWLIGWGWLPFMVLVMLLSRFAVRGSVRTARLSWHVEESAERRRQRLRTVLSVLWLLGLAGVLLLAFDLLPLETAPWTLPLFMLSFLAAAIANRFLKSLKCVSARDGWFRITGFSPRALRELSARQDAENRRLVEASAGRQTWKGFTVHLHRLPLSLLVRHQWWNPLLVATVAVMKLSRSPRFEREQYDSGEAREIAADRVDPMLAEELEVVRRMPEFGGWLTVRASRLPSPAGDIRTDTVVLLDPAGCQVLSLSLVRVATGNYSNQVTERALRSWGADGRLWVTCDQPLLRPWPEWILPERCRVGRVGRGGHRVLARLHARHAERIATLSLRSGTPDEVLEWLAEEAEARRATFEATGLYGPLRDLPAGPDQENP